MSIMRPAILFVSLLAAQASEKCTGSSCDIDDEVSLMQVKMEGVPAANPGSQIEAQCPTWTGKDAVPSAEFICSKCPKVLEVAQQSGLQLEVKRDPKALFGKGGMCYERATMTDPKKPSATGQQFQCVRDPSFSGPCTKDNQDGCVCHLGTKGEGMTFKQMVAGFKKTVQNKMTKDETKNGGDFSKSEEQGQICNWDGSGDTPDDKFVCSTCPKVKKVLAAKGKFATPSATYKVVHPKSSSSLYTSDADCFEAGQMVNGDNPTEAPTSFQCRRSILFTGPCTEANEDKCSCSLGKRGEGSTFKDLAAKATQQR
jgi:hypothetical protein